MPFPQVLAIMVIVVIKVIKVIMVIGSVICWLVITLGPLIIQPLYGKVH